VKTSRMYLIFGGAVFFLTALAMLISSIALFRSIDRSGGVLPGDARMAPALGAFFEQIKEVNSGDGAKRTLKSLESAMGLSSSGRPMEKVRQSFAPLLDHLDRRPREADPQYILQKKRDILEYGVNFYRKEAQGGSISVRSLVLNVVFDTQNALLNQNMEAERVSIGKLKEHLDQLKKSIVGYRDASVSYRVGNLENLIIQLDKGIGAASVWSETKADLIKKAEKASEQIIGEIRRDTEGGGEVSKREFVYSSAIAILIFLASGVVLIVGYKLMKHRFEDRAAVVLHYLRAFGRDKENSETSRELDRLRSDEDWSDLAAGIFSSEEQFIAINQAQMAVWRSITVPFVLFNRDRSVVLINQQAKSLFGIQSENTDFSDIICDAKIGTKVGNTATLLEMIQHAFHAPREDVYELFVKRDNADFPAELICCPVTTGPLAGGKIFLFREIRSEYDRVNKEVERQVDYIRDVVHKVTHFYEVDINTPEHATPPMKEMLGDLSQMKMRLDEREQLWKSETQGLLEQVNRQQEILSRMKEEMVSIRTSHEILGDTVDEIFRSEKIVSDDLQVVEHSLDLWIENRNRLMESLDTHASVLRRVRDYEEAMRKAVEGVRAMLSETEERYRELEQFRDEVRLASINMGIATASEENSKELVVRARSYATNLSEFCKRVRGLMGQVEEFTRMHPGGSLLPYLESHDVDPQVLVSLQEEHSNLSASLQRWKKSGEEALASGEKAKEIIDGMEKSDLLASQLSDTSLVIASQAQRNLSRWI
jgi:hypothetical protein